MLISSPRSITNYIAKIPYGTEKSVKLMRLELAENANAVNTCQLTCGIFLRIAIETSVEQSALCRLSSEPDPRASNLSCLTSFDQAYLIFIEYCKFAD